MWYQTLELNFNEGLNLICGENGVGKTTIIKKQLHINFYMVKITLSKGIPVLKRELLKYYYLEALLQSNMKSKILYQVMCIIVLQNM